MIALLSAALAAPSASGFTTPGALPATAATLQVAGLVDADRAYGQARLVGQVQVGRLAYDIELNGLAGTGTTHWGDVGLGTFAVGVRGFVAAGPVHHALGVHVRGQLPERVAFWVLAGAHARQPLAAGVTWDFTVGPVRAPLSVRITLGLGQAPVEDATEPMAGTGVSAMKVVPLGDRVGLLVEAHVAVDATPVALRVAARLYPAEAWTLDAGVQVPVILMVTHPVFVPALSLRGEL